MKYYSFIIMLFAFVSATEAQHLKYTNQTELGILLGQEGTRPIFNLKSFNGIKVNAIGFEAGISAGLDTYKEATIMPVSLGLRYVFLKEENMSAYLGFDAGYGLDWLENETEENQLKGGIMINPAAGIRLNAGGSASIHFSLGFKSQTFSTYRNETTYLYIQKDEYKYNRMVLNVGLTF